MKLALFLGCLIPTEQYAYELSAREVLPKLGLELVDLEGFSCCGEPVRSIGSLGWLYLSTRNMAIAEGAGLDVLSLCSTCHLSLCQSRHILRNDDGLKNRLDSLLDEEGLKYEGKQKIWHLVELLHDQIGLDKIGSTVKRPLTGLRLAEHIGCHAIRPSEIGRIDDPENPVKLKALIEALGAESPHYPEKLDCCAYNLSITHPDAALSIAGEKLRAIQGQGFDGVVTICPLCQKMFDARQSDAGASIGASLSLPVLNYLQLLGLAMDLEGEKLGLSLNQSPVDKILGKLR